VFASIREWIGNNPYARIASILGTFVLFFVLLIMVFSLGAYLMEDGFKWADSVRAKHNWGPNTEIADTRPYHKTLFAIGGIFVMVGALGGSVWLLVAQLRPRKYDRHTGEVRQESILQCKLRSETEIICHQLEERAKTLLPQHATPEKET